MFSILRNDLIITLRFFHLVNHIVQVKVKTFSYNDLLLGIGNGADEKNIFSPNKKKQYNKG